MIRFDTAPAKSGCIADKGANMRGKLKIFLLVALAATVPFLGCSQGGVGYTSYAPKGHTVYTVARKGAFFPDENFDVVLVHGFNDNRDMAREIADFLNQEEPNTYFYFEEN